MYTHRSHTLTGLRPARFTVAVADDDPAVLNSLRFLLETDGFQVRTFRSGAALLGAAGASRVDCYVLDYKMEPMNGVDLAAQLRNRHVATPIIVITGFPDETIVAKATRAGAHCVLLKPHLEDSLAAHIQAAIAEQSPPSALG